LTAVLHLLLFRSNWKRKIVNRVYSKRIWKRERSRAKNLNRGFRNYISILTTLAGIECGS